MEKSSLAENTAAGQLGGYLYQVERALIRFLKLEEGQTLYVEAFEDFHVSSGNSDAELVQVKHHLGKNPQRLTDGSRDLWKPLSIWAKAIKGGLAEQIDCQFILLTNSQVPDGSIADLITTPGKMDEALNGVRNVDISSETAIAGYMRVVQGLSDRELRSLIRRTTIVGSATSLDATANELKQLLRSKSFHENTCIQAAERLSGWFRINLNSRLDSKSGANFPESELHEYLSSLRDAMTEQYLPIYSEAPAIPELKAMTSAMFIRQLINIDATNRTQIRAIGDCFKARYLRSKWVDDGKILPERLSRYDDELVDRWSAKFEKLWTKSKELMIQSC